MALYPPYIKGNIPSFYFENGTYIIKVPFEDNPIVPSSSYNSYSLQIKSLNTNNVIATATTTIKEDNNLIFNNLIFNPSTNRFDVGQYYKCQIAYCYNNEIGTYSGVQTIKCTSAPAISIQNDNSIIQGRYINADASEIVSQYRFILYKNNVELDNTGWLLHNSTFNTINEDDQLQSIDNYDINYTIVDNDCRISYEVITINNLQLQEERALSEELLVPLDTKLNLVAKLNYENGYIDLYLSSIETSLTGLYNILRADDEDDFANWQIIYNFKLNQENPNRSVFKDFTIQQGKKYKYAIQQYNEYNIKSTYIIAETNQYEIIDYVNRKKTIFNTDQFLPERKIKVNYIEADFEDMFLFDGERQLKIKYNPKITSFKTAILESKIDTLGGKYPVFFRNGYTSYKEFPISGLIACEMDDEELFFNHDYLDRKLNGKNFLEQRNFKLEVLNWLNNGKPKLFKSPAEGNYIIRLMNNSLTPIEQIGRMIHTFNSQAYEIGDGSYKNLKQFNIIKYQDGLNLDDTSKIVKHYASKKATEVLITPIYGYNPEEDRESGIAIYGLKVDGAIPGTKLEIQQYQRQKKTITIGATGAYEVELDTCPINYIGLEEEIDTDFIITYAWRAKVLNLGAFNYIGTIKKVKVPAEEIEYVLDETAPEGENYGKTLRDMINTPYRKILNKLWHVRIEAAPTIKDEYEETDYIMYYGDNVKINCIPGRAYEYDTADWKEPESIRLSPKLKAIITYDYISKTYYDAAGNLLIDDEEIKEFIESESQEKPDVEL